jgi:hypothetical protein
LILQCGLSSCPPTYQEHQRANILLDKSCAQELLPPNYGEARGAERHADFVHKLRIVLKELNETSIWLRMIARSQLLREELIADIGGQNRQLCRIFTASLKTASSSK